MSAGLLLEPGQQLPAPGAAGSLLLSDGINWRRGSQFDNPVDPALQAARIFFLYTGGGEVQPVLTLLSANSAPAGPELNLGTMLGTLSAPVNLGPGDECGVIRYLGRRGGALTEQVVMRGNVDQGLTIEGFLAGVPRVGVSIGPTQFRVTDGGAERLVVPDIAGLPADSIALEVFDVTAAGTASVTRGAANSGGAGFRLLRVPN